MTRNDEPGTSTDRWKFDLGPGGRVTAETEDGCHVIAEMVMTTANGGGRFAISAFRCFRRDQPWPVDVELPLPQIEALANQRENFLILLDARFDAPPTDGPAPMKLPEALLQHEGRKPDTFYLRVVGFVQLCKQHRIAYGPRLAEDNDVSVNTVHGWLHEARRRGLDKDRQS